MYYDASWRLVEERIDENYASSPGLNRHMQNLWGARYIDDLIARRRDANRDGDYSDAGDETFYAITDVQFSVVAMLTSTGKLHERVAYDSYGTARHHWKDDVDGDGDVDSSDKSAVTALLNKAIYQSGYNPAADIDRSGTIDSADASLVSSKVIAALPAGEISDRITAGPDNTIGYDGYVINPENLLYTVRFRHYDTGLGRWLERDPAGYVDGIGLYNYVRLRPHRYSDPTGREAPTEEELRIINNLPGTWFERKQKQLCLKLAVAYAKHVVHNVRQLTTWEKLKTRTSDTKRFEGWEIQPGGRGILKGTLLDGPGDAIRHCVWNCMMGYCVGVAVAKQLGDAHEGNPDPSEQESSEMDLNNNQVGRDIWQQIEREQQSLRAAAEARYECFDKLQHARDECYGRCVAALLNGPLKVLEKSKWRDHNGDRPDPFVWGE